MHLASAHGKPSDKMEVITVPYDRVNSQRLDCEYLVYPAFPAHDMPSTLVLK